MLKKLIVLSTLSAALLSPISASAATFSITPKLSPVCTYSADINLDTQGKQADGSDVYMFYDPNKLNITSVDDGTIFPSYIGKNIDSTLGRISLSGLASITEPFVGSGLFARVNFQIKDNAPEGETSLKFDFDPENPTKTNDTNVVETTTIKELLTSVTNFIFTIGPRPSATPTPTPVPTPTATPTPSPTPTPTPTPIPVPVFSGLIGQYYNNNNFSGRLLTRVDLNLNFDWGSLSPDPSIEPDTFSVRWTGFVLPSYSENYTFYTRTDDGVRVWVNNQLVINKWVNQPPTEVSSAPIALKAGQKYSIRVDYFENLGGAVSQLKWSSASQAKQIIPQTNLFSQ